MKKKVFSFVKLVAIKASLPPPYIEHVPQHEWQLNFKSDPKDNARAFYTWRHRSSNIRGGFQPPQIPGCSIPQTRPPFPNSFMTSLFNSSAPVLSPTSPSLFQVDLVDATATSERDPDLPSYGYFEVAKATQVKLPASGSPARISKPLYPKMAIRTISPRRLRVAMTSAEFTPFSYLWDSKFSSVVTVPAPQNSFRSSSVSPQQLRFMIRNGFVKHFPLGEPVLGWASIFHVWKKDKTLRIIVNPEVNHRMSWPFPMSLPQTNDMVCSLTGKKFMVSEDLLSAFPQFPLDHHSSSHFVFEHFHQRFALCCLPQGFKGAPQLTQSFSLWLIQGCQDALAHVDNLLLSATSLVMIQAWLQRVRLKASSVGAILKGTPVIATQEVYCGRCFDLTQQAWKLDPTWCVTTAPWFTKLLFSKSNLLATASNKLPCEMPMLSHRWMHQSRQQLAALGNE